jgi:hypothetical protein
MYRSIKLINSGTQANDQHFQAFLLDGLTRWNKDRAEAAVEGPAADFRTFSNTLRHGTNLLAEAVLGKPPFPILILPEQYTGLFSFVALNLFCAWHCRF